MVDEDPDAEVLVHLTTPEAWATARASGALAPPSLDTEGFVHLCRPDQLPGVVERYYRDLARAAVLVVDPATLGAPVRWEPGPTGEDFPHLYGPIPTASVREVATFAPAAGEPAPAVPGPGDLPPATRSR